MTDSSADFAFLQSMQSDAAAYSNGNTEAVSPPHEEEDDDYDPTSLVTAASYDPSAQIEVSNTSSQSGSMPQSPSTPAVDQSRISNSNAEATTEVAPVPVKQPRTVGGFVVDDDEEEDEPTTLLHAAAGTHGVTSVARGSSDTPQRSISQTPMNSLPTSDVPIHKPEEAVQTTGAAETTSTMSNVPSVPGVSTQDKPASFAAGGLNPAVSTSLESPASTLQGRLPNDLVGMFEDRIAEDPRGDLDAWLGLIGEYRKRNKINEARAVYERFFAVFPTAVRQTLNGKSTGMHLRLFRLNNGSNTLGWSSKMMSLGKLNPSSRNHLCPI